jgi:UDP-glucose 4-epimerase
VKLAITGGAGFIGHHLVRAGVGRGHEVMVLDNLHRGSFERPGLSDAQLFLGDVRDLQSCLAAFAGADCVFHLAAQSNVMGSQSDPDYTYTTNVSGTWTVAQAAAQAGVHHLVFTSSREVYGEARRLPVEESTPLSPYNLYGASKAAAELLLQALPPGAPSVSIVRLANVIGPGDSGRVIPLWIEAARTDQELKIFGGEQVLDFIPVETVVNALLAIVESGRPLPGPMNIGSGRGTTLQQLAAHIVSLTQSSSRVCVLPPRGPEIRRFTADTAFMRRHLRTEPPADPLASLATWWREQ